MLISFDQNFYIKENLQKTQDIFIYPHNQENFKQHLNSIIKISYSNITLLII